MKVFVTGGCGFIGSHIVERLLARGDEVVVIDNFETGRRQNLAANPHLTLVEGSISDSRLVSSTIGDFAPELVIHTAASYKDPENWAGDALTNAVGTANVAKAARDAKARRLVYFQTALCYGLKPLQQPIQLDHPILPDNSSYAISKTAGEQYISLSGVDYVSFRLANIIGPRNFSGPLATFYQRLSTGKKCFVMNTRRDFVFVDDLVGFVMGAAEGHGHGPYHVSSGKDFSIQEMYDEVVRAMRLNDLDPVEVRERNPDDAFSILLDPSKTQRDFDRSVTTSLRTAVEKTVAFYQADGGVQQTYTHLKVGQENP